ncbi:hypothetical protein K438DRAFT_99703 [Mycena galopus ATCC 62051]|nr:hypothetical protein K438DRAFT_99703 [Mycena galopus ATCC 62051]
MDPVDTLEIEDEDVRIAVRALGQMRNGGHGHTNTRTAHNGNVNGKAAEGSTSTSHTPALSLSLASTRPASSAPHTPVDGDGDGEDADEDATGSPEAMEATEERPSTSYPSLARMQSLPLVSGALRVYDTAKTNSRVVQYTSSLVSSSLRHGTSLLPAGSGERMDEFAGGMLDRVSRLFLSSLLLSFSRHLVHLGISFHVLLFSSLKFLVLFGVWASLSSSA